MDLTTVILEDQEYTAHYEFTEGEAGDYEYPPISPTVTLWRVTDERDLDVTGKLTSLEWLDIEEQIAEYEEL